MSAPAKRAAPQPPPLMSDAAKELLLKEVLSKDSKVPKDGFNGTLADKLKAHIKLPSVINADIERLKERLRSGSQNKNGIPSNSSFKLTGFEDLSHDSGVVIRQLESLAKRSVPSQPKVAPQPLPTQEASPSSKQEAFQCTLPSIHEMLSKHQISSREVIQNYIAGYESPASDSSFESTSAGNEYVQNILSNDGAQRPNTSKYSTDNILLSLVEQVQNVKKEYQSLHKKVATDEAERKDLVKCLTTSVNLLATNQNSSNTWQTCFNEVRSEIEEIRKGHQDTRELMAEVLKILPNVSSENCDSNNPPCESRSKSEAGKIDEESISTEAESAEKENQLQIKVHDLTDQIGVKQQEIANHVAEKQLLEGTLKTMEQDLAEKDQQISAEVKKTQDEISKIELEKSKILEASSNQERKLQESIFNLKVDLKSSQSAMEILKRDFLKQTDSMMNEQSEKLSSKHEFEKKQLEATITAKERHLNEAILSIQHEAESTSRELFQANLDKQRFQDQLEKLNERCHVQAVAYIRRTGELTADLEQLSAELAKCKEDNRIALAEIAKTKDIEISQVREEHQITLDILKQRADEIGILSEKLRQAEEQNNSKLSKQSQLSDDLKKALEDGRVAMETITQRFEQQLEEAAKQHQVDMSSIKNERDQLSSALSQCKKDHEEAIEITQQQSSDIESYKEEIQQLADRINDLENRNKDLTRENSSLDTSNENKKYVMKLNSLKMSLDKAQRLMELNIMASSAPSKGTSIHKTDSESASVSSVSISNSIHFGARPTVSHVDVENMRQSISRLASTYRLDSETEFAIQQMIASVLDLTKYRTSDTFIPGDNECSTTPGSQSNVDNCAPLSNTSSVTENIESTTEFSADITNCSDSNSKCTGLKSAGASKSSLTRHSVKNVDDYEPTTSSKLLLSGTGADLTESTQSFVQATKSDPRYINASAPPHEACTLHSTKSSAVMLKTVASESLEFDIVIEVPITSPEVANMDPASPIYYHTGSSDLLRQLNSKTELPIDRDSQASIEPYMLAGMSSRTAFNAMDDEEDDSFEIISTFTTSGQSKCLTKEKSSLANVCQSTIADGNNQIVSAFHTDSQVSIETYMSSLTNVKVCSPVPSQAAVPIAKVVSTEDKHNLVKSYGKITSAPVTAPAITDIPPPEDDSTSVKTPRFSPQERALREKKLIECQRQMFREYYEDKRRQEEEERKQNGDGSDTSDSDCESPTTSQQNIYEASPSFHNTMKRTYSRSSSRLSCVASNNTLERYRPSTSQTVLENITEQDETAEPVDSSPVKPQATQAIDHARSSSSSLARSESHTTPTEPTHYLYGSLSGQRIRRMKKSPEQIAEFEANRARLRKEMLACRKETRNFLDELSDLSDDELYNN